MMELFEEIFSAVCEKNDMDWYEVFDGALMDEVNDRIMKATGMTMDELEDNDEYCEWYGDMAEDL